jgi:hypothetical protein
MAALQSCTAAVAVTQHLSYLCWLLPCSVLEELGRVSTAQAVLLQAGGTGVLAAASWLLWQQGSPKSA